MSLTHQGGRKTNRFSTMVMKEVNVADDPRGELRKQMFEKEIKEMEEKMAKARAEKQKKDEKEAAQRKAKLVEEQAKAQSEAT